MTPLQQAEKALSEAKAVKKAAADDLEQATAAEARHAEQIAKAEADLMALDQTVEESLTSPEAGAAWRTKRAPLRDELEGLRLQAAVFRQRVIVAEAAVEALSDSLDEPQRQIHIAKRDEILASPELDAACELIAQLWWHQTHSVRWMLDMHSAAEAGYFAFHRGDKIHRLRHLMDRFREERGSAA